jgi:hypothetical protein
VFAFNQLKANVNVNSSHSLQFFTTALLRFGMQDSISIFSSTMEGYRGYFHFCRNVGIYSGLLPSTVNSPSVVSRGSFPILKFLLVTFQFAITLSVLILDLDYLFQTNPNSKSLSDWIFKKGNALTYTTMGAGIISASFALRHKINLFYDKVEFYLNLCHEGAAIKWEGKILAALTIIITIVIGTKSVIFDLYDMIWKTQMVRQVSGRLIVPYNTVSVKQFYFNFLLNTFLAPLHLIHQGYVALLLVLGASFISDAFHGIVHELDNQIHFIPKVELLELNCSCPPKSKHGHPSVQSSFLKLEERWKELAKIFNLFSVISGIYLCILFPNTAAGFGTRLGAGIAGSAGPAGNWSDYSPRLFSGLLYAIRIAVLVEMGHRFKQNVSDRRQTRKDDRIHNEVV